MMIKTLPATSLHIIEFINLLRLYSFFLGIILIEKFSSTGIFNESMNLNEYKLEIIIQLKMKNVEFKIIYCYQYLTGLFPLLNLV